MSLSSKRRYFIKTYGCQANIADSQKLAAALELLGFAELKLPKLKTEVEELKYIFSQTDVLFINSCSVRQKSEDKIYGIGKEVKNLLKNGKKKKPLIVLTGCLVGSTLGERKRFNPEILRKKTFFVDEYLYPVSLRSLSDIFRRRGLTQEQVIGDIASVTPKIDKTDPKHAYVNISTGCDNFCSYCVVPYSRGKEISRSEEKVVEEITKLLKLGVEKITLCAQNVNSWGLSPKEKFKIRLGSKDKLPFVKLLKKVHELKDLKNLDFISSNPFDFTDDLVEVLKLPKISNYLHIAVQSGNDEILKAMNRRYTAVEFEGLINRIRKAKPGIEIGTDLIVGFPGETVKMFMDTVRMVKKLKFNVAFISMYSQRKGTYAESELTDDVPRLEKKRRLAYLTKVWKDSKND